MPKRSTSKFVDVRCRKLYAFEEKKLFCWIIQINLIQFKLEKTMLINILRLDYTEKSWIVVSLFLLFFLYSMF